MTRRLSTKNGQSKNRETMAKANLAVDLVPPGCISAGAEVPREHVGVLASITVWTIGAVLSAFIPATTLHVSRGVLTSTESLAVVSVQFLLTTYFTIRAARSTDRLTHSGTAE